MNRFVFSKLVLICCYLFSPASLSAAEVVERPGLDHVFTDRGYKGTFVLYSLATDRLTVVNSTRAAMRFIPASTFKIANSLIALGTGAVKDVNEIIPHGGKPQPFKSWENDMSMRDAIRISNVPIYQEIARNVGIEKYESWLERLDYGNKQIGNEVESFWLDGPLKISAIEQVSFLGKLAQEKLMLDGRIQSAVIDILKLGKKNGIELFGKTGWTNAPDPDIGWFVGWVVDGEDKHVFALNMDIHLRQDAKFRKLLALEFLKKLEIY